MERLKVGFGVSASWSAELVTRLACRGEELGYHSFWTSHQQERPALQTIAQIAKATTQMTLGIGAIPLSHAMPEDIAQEVRRWTLPSDRFLLGVGSGEEDGRQSAVDRVHGGLQRLRSLLDCDLVVGALGPRMCHLAGEAADGVLFTLVSPSHARQSAEWVRAGAERAGRLPPKLYAYVRATVGEGAGERLEHEVVRYMGYPAFERHLRRVGVAPRDLGITARSVDEIRGALDRWRDAMRGCLDELVIRAVMTADEHECLALLAGAAVSRG